MRCHRQVVYEIIDTHHLDSKRDAERHGEDHKQRVDGARHAHLLEPRQHIAHKVDERYTWHDKQGASHHRMPRRSGLNPRRQLQSGGGVSHAKQPRNHGADKCHYRDIDIWVHFFACQIHAHTQSHCGSDRSVEERRPVAAKLNAEATTCQTATQSHLPRLIDAWASTDFVELLLKLVEGIVVGDGTPREFTDCADGSHIDGMVGATLESGVRTAIVAIVHHQQIVVNVNLQILLLEAEERCRALHVTQNALRVGRTLHKFAAHLQQHFHSSNHIGVFTLIVKL